MLRSQYLLVALMILVLGSCSKKEVTHQENTQEQTEELDEKDPLVRLILAEGFNKKSIVAYKDRYVVGGDIIFFKKDYESLPRTPQTEQTQTHFIVSRDYRSNVKIFLHSGFTNVSLDAALNAAIAAYNAVGSTIQFTRVTSAAAADIEISRNDFLGANICGQGTYPLPDGKPGRSLYISESVLVNYSITSDSQLTFLLAHEIGHCIGFRHTNWQQLGEGPGDIEAGAINIPGTPLTDANSVMNGGTCGFLWNGFSAFDAVALNNLYNNNFTWINKLEANMQLKQNEFIRSLDGRFTVTMQPDGNLVLYMYNTPLWASYTCCDANNVRAIMQADGNFVIYRANNTARWGTGTGGYVNGYITIQNDGNLVIYQNGVARWGSGTCCH